MNISDSKSPDSANWRDLYRAAILELDPMKMFERIAEAEKALRQRAKELFQIPGDNIEEEQALDDAMYALHALQIAGKRSSEMGERNSQAARHQRTGTW
jgi:hypothetical protein